MRVAIVSDIHGNRRAFEAVLGDLGELSPDLVVHGGDLASGGAHPAEIIDHIRSLGWPGVCGNTDEMLFAPETLARFAAENPKISGILARVQESVEPTVARLGQERIAWLRTLPRRFSHDDFTLVHASPDDLWRAPGPNATDEELTNAYAALRSPIAVYGHIHVPYLRRLGKMVVANSGSVGQPYDGDRRASYLVIDGQSATIRRVEYDVEAEAEDMRRSGFPQAEWITRILLAGKYCAP